MSELDSIVKETYHVPVLATAVTTSSAAATSAVRAFTRLVVSDSLVGNSPSGLLRHSGGKRHYRHHHLRRHRWGTRVTSRELELRC